MLPLLLITMAMLALNDSTITPKIALGKVDDKTYCMAYLPDTWFNRRLIIPNSGIEYTIIPCSSLSTNETEAGHGSKRREAIYVDPLCNVSLIPETSTVFLHAPFSPSLVQRLNSTKFRAAFQVRGNLLAQIRSSVRRNNGVHNTKLKLEPMSFGKIYWGSIIMYFYALIYVSISGIMVLNGQTKIQQHARHSVMDRYAIFQTRLFKGLLLGVVVTTVLVEFIGYLLKPLIFQQPMAIFLALLATIGFYHVLFPIIVIIAVRCVKSINKTYWTVERIVVCLAGGTIFGVWMYYRSVPEIWPLQLFLFSCVGVVPIRFSPLNSIKKMLMLTVLAVAVCLLQSVILPLAIGAPPRYLDVVTVQARLPQVLPGPLFAPDQLEGNLMGFRIPTFDKTEVCADVIDSTFGIIGFILPAIFVKAAILIDTRIHVVEQTEQSSVTNYTVAVVTYLVCHVIVFILSYVLSSPINSSAFYLPGIVLALTLNNIRTRTLRIAFFNETRYQPQDSNIPAAEIVNHDSSTVAFMKEQEETEINA